MPSQAGLGSDSSRRTAGVWLRRCTLHTWLPDGHWRPSAHKDAAQTAGTTAIWQTPVVHAAHSVVTSRTDTASLLLAGGSCSITLFVGEAQSQSVARHHGSLFPHVRDSCLLCGLSWQGQGRGLVGAQLRRGACTRANPRNERSVSKALSAHCIPVDHVEELGTAREEGKTVTAVARADMLSGRPSA